MEVWFKQRRKEDVVVTPFGILGEGGGRAVAETRPQTHPQCPPLHDDDGDCLYMAVVCGMCSSKTVPTPYKTSLYPFIPYYCHRKKNGQPYGRVCDSSTPTVKSTVAARSAVHAEQPPLDLRAWAIRDRNALATELPTQTGRWNWRTASSTSSCCTRIKTSGRRTSKCSRKQRVNYSASPVKITLPPG